MRLSPEEETFLRHWMYDEVHYQDGRGPAKVLQVRHRVTPADLGILIAAAIPDLRDQEAAGAGVPPKTQPIWPWTEASFGERLTEARSILAARRQN